jgi:hypothetical protein
MLMKDHSVYRRTELIMVALLAKERRTLIQYPNFFVILPRKASMLEYLGSIQMEFRVIWIGSILLLKKKLNVTS